MTSGAVPMVTAAPATVAAAPKTPVTGLHGYAEAEVSGKAAKPNASAAPIRVFPKFMQAFLLRPVHHDFSGTAARTAMVLCMNSPQLTDVAAIRA
jgi:hypothetical protein